jgi:hypothetical protein
MQREEQWFRDRIDKTVAMYNNGLLNETLVTALNVRTLCSLQETGFVFADWNDRLTLLPPVTSTPVQDGEGDSWGATSVKQKETLRGFDLFSRVIEVLRDAMRDMGPTEYRQFVRDLHDHTGRLLFVAEEESEQKDH